MPGCADLFETIMQLYLRMRSEINPKVMFGASTLVVGQSTKDGM